MTDLKQQLLRFWPLCEQEERDRALILRCLDTMPDVFDRSNPIAHITASGWVVNADRSRVLMAYHKIYDSWAWLGGHADGERDLLRVAMREVCEESGLACVQAVSPQFFSIESLTVDGHWKRGQYISSHLHLNLTYLLQADDTLPLRAKEDENSGVRWFTPQQALQATNEPWFRDNIYAKLIARSAAE